MAIFFKIKIKDFADGPVIKNLTGSAGDTNSIPGLKDPICPEATKPMHPRACAPQQGSSPCSPQLEKAHLQKEIQVIQN